MSTIITALITRATRQARTAYRRAGAALATAALAALALAIMGSGTASARPASPPAPAAIRTVAGPAPCAALPFEGPTWMHDLGNCLWSRKLSEIVIPGSHDSTTYSLNTALAVTQSEDLTHQLDDGMREFDIRVEYANPLGSPGWNWYAHHGSGITDQVSTWLTLSSIFSSVAQWAQQPGHEQEIILLNLIMENNTDDLGACVGLYQQLGDALVSPFELQQAFGTTDPGQVTLGQLWSLPDPHNYARVIMDNSQCLANNFGSGPAWGSFSPPGQTLYSGYYADQCTADGVAGYGPQVDGITKLVLQAAGNRATVGPTSEPIPPGPPKVGGLYVLSIQGTPEFDCLKTPASMVPDERKVLEALGSAWYEYPSIRQSLNIISADFVQDIPLLDEAAAADQDGRSAAPPAPTITNYTGGDGQVTVAFSDTNYGPDPITFDTVTATDKTNPAGSQAAWGDSSPLTVKGLYNGDVYLLTVTATSADGTSPPSQEGGLQVGVPPKVVSEPAANGIVGQPYSSGFTVTGAPPPAVTLVSGGLPPGLTLGSDGTLTGTPTKAGSYTFTVRAKNPLNHADATATVTISGIAPAAPTITGLTNGDGQVGVAFSDASTGTDPITSYSVKATDQNDPTAPPVTATGPGSPITVKGLTNGDPYVFAVAATSADGTSPWSRSSDALNVGVAPVIAAGPANGTAGQPYSSGFTTTGAPPPAITQVSGNLPPGLTLGSDGTLTGTPTKAGSDEFTVQATNPVGIYSASVTVTISPATLGAAPPAPGGRQLRATICATPAGHQPVCAVRTLTGPLPPLDASAAATLLRGTVTYAVGRATAGYSTLTLSGQRPIPAGSYTLILRYGHHAIIVPVTIR